MLTIPVWVLLGFAFWTLLTLIVSVGFYRWGRILTGRSPITDYADGLVKGPDYHKRAMRAHANCVENLPVYGAIVLFIVVAGVQSQMLDTLALVLLGARVVHTFIHVGFQQTTGVILFRFSFFFVQIVCMFWMASYAGLKML